MGAQRMRMLKMVCIVAGVAAALPATAELTDAQIAELYAKPSPFEQGRRDRWIAETENAFAVRDINPQSPVHLLVISKKRYPTLLQAPEVLLGEMMVLARRVAEEQGIAREGFRLVINTHPEGGQGVYHLHIHVLGGRHMRWPPG
jgi:Diadenosine tetraphosphate (Ap4A) hydrolase and other HIT family hydrolases